MKLSRYIFFILTAGTVIYSCEEDTPIDSGNGEINNPENAPVLTCADFEKDITLENDPGREVDYIIDCLVDVDNINVEIIDGAVIEFTEGSGFIFREGSSFSFYALPGSVPPVILRGNKNETGYWKGIHVACERSSMNGVEIHDAGSADDPMFYGAVTISGGSDLTSVLINNSRNYGVYYEDEIGVWQTFRGVEITNSNAYPVRIGLKEVSHLGAFRVNSYSNNNPDRIQVVSQPLDNYITFPDQGIPYEISETIIANESITIQDNVELIFKTGTRLVIQKQLTAWDDGGDPIVFTSQDKNPGSWKGIIIQSDQNSDSHSMLINVLVEYGGQESDMAANIAIESGKVNIKQCQIYNSAACGLKYVVSQTTLYEGENYYLDNQGGSICEIE